MNVKRTLIWELIPYEFEVGDNVTEVTQNIGRAKGKDGVGHSKVPRWFKKFCFGCKYLNDQAISGKPKIVVCKSVLQAIEANSASSSQRPSVELSVELDISQSNVVHHFHELD